MALFAKTRASITAGLLFFVISAPFTYTLVDKLVNALVSSIAPQYTTMFKIADGGRPTNYGLIVHSVVYALITYSLMGY